MAFAGKSRRTAKGGSLSTNRCPSAPPARAPSANLRRRESAPREKPPNTQNTRKEKKGTGREAEKNLRAPQKPPKPIVKARADRTKPLSQNLPCLRMHLPFTASATPEPPPPAPLPGRRCAPGNSRSVGSARSRLWENHRCVSSVLSGFRNKILPVPCVLWFLKDTSSATERASWLSQEADPPLGRVQPVHFPAPRF